MWRCVVVDVAESTLSGICRHQASRQAAMDDAIANRNTYSVAVLVGVCTLGRGAAHLNPKLQLDELQKNTYYIEAGNREIISRNFI